MAGIRDVIIHVYFGVNLGVGWNTANERLPELKRDIHVIVKELFPSPHTLFWSRSHHFLFEPFLSKSFSVYMWIQCLTFIYTHCSFKSSLNSTPMKNYCQQSAAFCANILLQRDCVYLAIFLGLAVEFLTRE